MLLVSLGVVLVLLALVLVTRDADRAVPSSGSRWRVSTIALFLAGVLCLAVGAWELVRTR